MTARKHQTHIACPFQIVNAPARVVWSLLDHPADWGNFYKVRITEVNPKGLLHKGQLIKASTGFGPFQLVASFEITGVDRAKDGTLDMMVKLPFGITNNETMQIQARGDKCMVKYNCRFDFGEGWVARAIYSIFRNGFDTGPADSLSRLKRAAEEINKLQ